MGSGVALMRGTKQGQGREKGMLLRRRWMLTAL